MKLALTYTCTHTTKPSLNIEKKKKTKQKTASQYGQTQAGSLLALVSLGDVSLEPSVPSALILKTC
jgi:hypothetical protein